MHQLEYAIARDGYFGGEVAWKGTCLCLSRLCYFGDAFVMQYISLINLLKTSLIYDKRLTISVQCTLLGLVSGYHKRPILLR